MSSREPVPEFHTIGLGEVLLEFTRGKTGFWRSTPSGDILNTLFYRAREGCSTGLVTRFGDDPFLGEIMHTLDSEEIGHSLCAFDPIRPNGIYFVSTDVTGERSFHYRRADAAARWLFESLDVDALVRRLQRTEFFLVTGISLAILHDRPMLLELLRQVSSETGVTIVFDPNVRAGLWESIDQARLWIEQLLPAVDIFLPSDEDLTTLWGDSYDIAEIIVRFNLDHVVLKRGAEETMLWRDGEETRYSVSPAPYLRDTTGAGDAFNAGYLAAVGRGLSPTEAVGAGQELAARVIGVRGAIDQTFHREGESR